MLTAVLKALKMLLSCCPKNSQDAAVLTALKAVQDAEKNHPHKDQVQRLIPISVAPRHAATLGGRICRRLEAGGTALLKLQVLFEAQKLGIQLTRSDGFNTGTTAEYTEL
jgi:hypothetical protein